MLLLPNCLVTTAIRSTALFPDRHSPSILKARLAPKQKGGTRAALFFSRLEECLLPGLIGGRWDLNVITDQRQACDSLKIRQRLVVVRERSNSVAARHR